MMVCAALTAPAANRRTPVVAAVEKALPTVVNISTEKLVQVQHADPLQQFRGQAFDEFFRQFFQQQTQPEYQLKHSLGSGVVIDPLGYILTNFHVIERASRIQVTLSDGRAFQATLLAGDPVNDIALIKIEAPAPLAAAEFAADEDTLLGETVIVLGNPFGLGNSVTVGVLSAKDREAKYGGKVLYKDILQTDAAVNPGSSGGPLVNLDGQLIGLNVAIHQEAQNIGFAVPVKRMRELLAYWLTPRLLKKATLGFEVAAQSNRLVVAQVAPDRKLAVAAGDEITAVNRKPVQTLLDYERALLPLLPTHYVRIGTKRGGATNEVVAQMLALPKPDGAKLARERLGLELKPFAEIKGTATFARQGIAIASIRAGSAAEQAGLVPGLIVASVNGQDVTTLDDMGAALADVRVGEPVKLLVVKLREQQGLLLAQRAQATVKAE
jgi:serine protease Do